MYAGLTFAMAYPFSASPGSRVIADAPDTHLYMWTLAWDTYALLHQPLLIFDANIYYPYTNTLAYSENLIGSAFFAAPIIWLTGNLVLAMNLVALLTCALCGVGAYVLARRLHLTPHAAFICGLVFAFAPPRFFRMGQLHMTAVQWMPFALASLHTYFERGRRRDLLWATGCFSLQALSSGHGAVFLATASAFMVTWRFAFGQRFAVVQWARDFGAAGAYLLAPSVWVMLPYRMAQAEAGLQRSYDADAMPGVASLAASPSRLHMYLQTRVLGRVVNDEAIAFLFPGILVLTLAVIAIATWRPWARSVPARSLRSRLCADTTAFYGLLAVVSTLMFVQWPIDVWRHVFWWPGFNFIRAPSRFMLLVMLCLSVLAAVTFDRLMVHLCARRRAAATVVLSVLLLGEYASHPYSGVPYKLDIPAIDRWLDTQPKPFAIAEVPVSISANPGVLERQQTQSMLHATAHWQKTVHGYSGMRRPLHSRLYQELTAFPDALSIASLRELGVTYVVVHTDAYADDHWRRVEARLRASTDLRLEHVEGAGRVYSILARQPAH
jgi:hypothetical protein